MRYRVKKTVSIDAHHKLTETIDPDSPCRRDHGHRYVFEATFVSNISHTEGHRPRLTYDVVIDFSDIAQTIRQYDHRSFNQWLSNPTAERILDLVAYDLTELVAQRYGDICWLEKIAVWETPTSYVELEL